MTQQRGSGDEVGTDAQGRPWRDVPPPRPVMPPAAARPPARPRRRLQDEFDIVPDRSGDDPGPVDPDVRRLQEERRFEAQFGAWRAGEGARNRGRAVVVLVVVLVVVVVVVALVVVGGG